MRAEIRRLVVVMNYEMGEASEVPAGGTREIDEAKLGPTVFKWKDSEGGWKIGRLIVTAGIPSRHLMQTPDGRMYWVPPYVLEIHPPRSEYEAPEFAEFEVKEEIISDLLEKITPGKWRAEPGCVVSDDTTPVRYNDEVLDYGGRLVCETIGPSDAKLVAAAPALLRMILDVVNGRVTIDELVRLVHEIAPSIDRSDSLTRKWMKPNRIEFRSESKSYSFFFEPDICVNIDHNQLEALIGVSDMDQWIKVYGLMNMSYAIQDGKIVRVAIS